jgi:hypothetical protein
VSEIKKELATSSTSFSSREIPSWTPSPSSSLLAHRRHRFLAGVNFVVLIAPLPNSPCPQLYHNIAHLLEPFALASIMVARHLLPHGGCKRRHIPSPWAEHHRAALSFQLVIYDFLCCAEAYELLLFIPTAVITSEYAPPPKLRHRHRPSRGQSSQLHLRSIFRAVLVKVSPVEPYRALSKLIRGHRGRFVIAPSCHTPPSAMANA